MEERRRRKEGEQGARKMEKNESLACVTEANGLEFLYCLLEFVALNCRYLILHAHSSNVLT